MTINIKLLLKVVFLTLAFLAAGYSAYMAFKNEFGSTICNINDVLSCANVNESEYSKIFGIPIAYFGVLLVVFNILYTLFSHLPSLAKLREKYSFFITFAIIINTIAALFSILLLGLQFFVIQSLCIFCLIFDISVIGFTVLLYIDFMNSQEKN